MSSKRSRRKIPYCLISNQTNQKWFDFTLQKNHLFGEDYRGKYVVRGIDDRYVYLYRAELNVPGATHFNPRPSLRGAYIWHQERIDRQSLTGQLILQTHAETGKKPVEYAPTHKLARQLYNPRNTVWDSGFQKMPHMRIPMGAYEEKSQPVYKNVERHVKTRRVYGGV